MKYDDPGRPEFSERHAQRDRPKKAKLPPPTPFDMAVRFLKVRDRSEKELRLKLRQKGVEADQIDVTIERMRTLGYLDDERFAKARAESLLARGRLGPRGVAARLSAAGVARESVKDAVDGAMESRSELELAIEVLQKKHPQARGTTDQKVRARAVRFLLGRGFSSSVISKALSVEFEPEPGSE
jgi:regulatory protein